MTQARNIQEDFSAPSLVKAIEDNQFEYLMDLERSPRVTIYEGPELTWFLTGVPFPGFNRIVRARFEADDIDAKIEAALAPFRSRGLPMLWHIGPSTQPSNLRERLLARGLRRTAEEPGMATDLSRLETNQPLPPGLRIERVQDTERLEIWGQITGRAFDFSGELGDAFFKIEASLAEYPARRLYLGSVEGEPVATALLFLGAGAAGIYGVGTIPEARRQGIGRAMTVVPLLEARDMGYRIGVLHASPMGEGIYRRLGFQEYCKLGRYVWRKPAAQG